MLLSLLPYWDLQSSCSGEYSTTLNYTQLDVPIATDSSLDLILPVLAQPIVQKIVSGSVLGYAEKSSMPFLTELRAH